MKRKVVVGQSSVTAAQLKDLFRMIDDGTIGFEELKNFLGSPMKFAPDRVTIVRALNILGDRKVLTADQAAKAWGKEGQCLDQAIRYSEATLRDCAEHNRQGLSDWRLVYILGLSLREQIAIRGADPGRQPCFYKDWGWWLKKPEDDWATQNPEAGYHLLDFSGRWGSTSWQKQEDEIVKLGSSHYERAHEAVISEAVFSNYQTYQERLLENWYHWGKNLDFSGERVYVGGFIVCGLGVSSRPDRDGAGGLRVCLARKFQN